MTELETELSARRLVRLPDAARALNVKTAELRRLMAAQGLPVIALSQRRQNILLSHLDQLIAAGAKPATERAA